MKLFIVGSNRSGKDTVAQMIKKFTGLTFESSSHYCMRKFLRDKLSVKYETEEECFEDRVNHREEWYNIIRDYNYGDPTRLTKEIFAEYDIYVGIRNLDEFLPGRRLADLAIWVDRGINNIRITPQDCDISICNHGGLLFLEHKVRRVCDTIIRRAE
jgi:hypothetical protein